ncbi:MAG: hypothetical protein ACKVHU_11550 [Acidimicrobiales bacterium]|jgi:hypothetical protein
MAIEVETKDCTALGDAELAEMAEIAGADPISYDVGELSKRRENWVLATIARDGGKLVGYSLCTLERVGGDPTVLIGLGSIKRSSRRDTVLRAVMADQYRRAVLAFPDEDVLVACLAANPAVYDALKMLDRVCPRPGYDANGEDRAWGRRLAKRFDVVGEYKAREFRITGEGSQAAVLDHVAAKPETTDAELITRFNQLDPANGDAYIVFGWASRENLAKLA